MAPLLPTNKGILWEAGRVNPESLRQAGLAMVDPAGLASSCPPTYHSSTVVGFSLGCSVCERVSKDVALICLWLEPPAYLPQLSLLCEVQGSPPCPCFPILLPLNWERSEGGALACHWVFQQRVKRSDYGCLVYALSQRPCGCN